MRNNLKVSNQDTRATSMASLWCIHCKPKAHNTTRPSATSTDSEQANARWYVEEIRRNNQKNNNNLLKPN